MKPSCLGAEVVERWGVKLSHDQAYRAKRKAMKLVQGDYIEQFTYLRSYGQELLKPNPNSTVVIQCANSDDNHVFERIYRLVPVVQGISANIESRLCVKHLYGNWKKKHFGLELKEVRWAAARATTFPTWERATQRMNAIKEGAWKDMLDVPACHWSISHFRTYLKCDLQVNNMCEAFNM
ncbi:hypothetical protein KIW84_072203 [Lathyrus oleraceus]|uniref:Uncharacterized protein n=1 Tax=Pisum sativum TaxID=3888 RepID=A0A9D4VKN2_PEA|nr:hypothetical protein KIW84_072203 [Pisum sativum]